MSKKTKKKSFLYFARIKSSKQFPKNKNRLNIVADVGFGRKRLMLIENDDAVMTSTLQELRILSKHYNDPTIPEKVYQILKEGL